MVALGILWRQDYTHQFIGEDLMPYDMFPNLDYVFKGYRCNSYSTGPW